MYDWNIRPRRVSETSIDNTVFTHVEDLRAMHEGSVHAFVIVASLNLIFVTPKPKKKY